MAGAVPAGARDGVAKALRTGMRAHAGFLSAGRYHRNPCRGGPRSWLERPAAAEWRAMGCSDSPASRTPPAPSAIGERVCAGAGPMTLCCLLPGAPDLEPSGPPRQYPLGTLLVLPEADGGWESLAHAVQHWRVSPWCPTVLLGTCSIPHGAFDVLRPAAMHITPVVADGFPPGLALRTAIRRRPGPDAPDVADYLAFRCSKRLATLYLSVVEPNRSMASLRRPLRRLRVWSPHDWVRVDRCMRVIARAAAEGWTEAESAQRAGIDVKTLSGWCARYLGRSWRALLRLGAWEPVLEAALWTARYVTDPSPGPN